MFKENKYTRWYWSLISRAIDRPRQDIYYECHHIIPKSLGGPNENENLVLLTAKEHFVAHLLLTKMVSGSSRRKMVFAFWRMVHGKQSDLRHVPSSRRYQLAKKAMSFAISEQNRGQIVTERQRELLRRRVPWNKGKEMSQDFKDKISQVRKGRTSSEDTRRKISNGVKNKLKIAKQSTGKGARPRIRFDLENINTGETESTFNLKDWCKNKGFSSGMIYLGKSSWKIVRKTQLKTSKVIL